VGGGLCLGWGVGGGGGRRWGGGRGAGGGRRMRSEREGRRGYSGCVCLLGVWGRRGRCGGGLIGGAIGWGEGGGLGLCGGLGEG